eukprot:gene18283-21808_t
MRKAPEPLDDAGVLLGPAVGIGIKVLVQGQRQLLIPGIFRMLEGQITKRPQRGFDRL